MLKFSCVKGGIWIRGTGNHYNPFESEVFIKVVGTSSEIFGSGCYVFGNPRNDEMKSHAFDSEKVGRYKNYT